MKIILVAIAVLLSWGGHAQTNANGPTDGAAQSLKELFDGKFYMGTAMNRRQINGENQAEVALIKTQFNSITPENVMKSERLQPREGEFTFDLADAFVAFGEAHDMHIIGHTLIWHSQAPRWFFTDKQGNDVSPEVLKQRMENHIKTVVGRYKGRVHGWDVVNEAILDDGSYRESKFYEILGEQFIQLAFQYAHEADPEAALYYNDYSMANAGKRGGVVQMVKALKENGLRIDGIGMQGHVGMHHPSLDEFEKSITTFAALGVTVMVTELDLSVLPSPGNEGGAEISDTRAYQEKFNPYTKGLPDEVNAAFTERYLDFFKMFLKHADKISRVTTWGAADAQSWKNNWPVRGRTDYPLLFDREYQAKPIVHALIEIMNNQ